MKKTTLSSRSRAVVAVSHRSKMTILRRLGTRNLEKRFFGEYQTNVYPAFRRKNNLNMETDAECFARTRQYFEDLKVTLGINNLDDWYETLSADVISRNNGKSILSTYHGSPADALKTAYPQHNWIPWKFNSVPAGFWKLPQNQRQYFDWLGNQLGVKHLDDWYPKLTQQVMIQNHGRGLLNHKGSPKAALMTAYPEHNWNPWKFNIIPVGYWKSKENQRKYFDWLGNQLGIQHWDDWYGKLSCQVMAQNYGQSLISAYKGSPTAALMAAYPEHNWIPWKFSNVSAGFWKSKENQRKYFDWLGNQLGIQHLDDWYEKLSSQALIQNCGQSLLATCNGSPKTALMEAYPEHNWVPWKFVNKRKKEHVSHYLAELSEKLSIQTLDDWYRVDSKQLGLGHVVKEHKGLYNFFKAQFPHHPWDPNKFNQTRKTQRWLTVTLKKMFPEEEIVEDFMHPKAVFPATNRPMQLDVFIPSKSLAFEYQGKQHYENVYMFSPSKVYQQLDEEKRALCVANNIKLIEIPYWWNRSQQELQEMMTTQLQKLQARVTT